MRPKGQMGAFVERILRDMADSGPFPGIMVGIELRIGFDMVMGEFFPSDV